MARASAPGIVAVMADRDLIVTLELHVRGDCLSGRIADEVGPAIEFSGRIGLLSAIETLMVGEQRQQESSLR
jgi:hypothetical protein